MQRISGICINTFGRENCLVRRIDFMISLGFSSQTVILRILIMEPKYGDFSYSME